MTPHNPRDDLHMPRNGISPLFSGVKVGVGVGIAEMMGQSGDKGRKKDMYIMCRVQCRILTRMNRERMRVFNYFGTVIVSLGYTASERLGHRGTGAQAERDIHKAAARGTKDTFLHR